VTIDWSARAAAVFANTAPAGTDKTDVTPLSSVSSVSSVVSAGGESRPEGVSSVSSVVFRGAEPKTRCEANRWRAYFKSGRTREVTVAPAISAEEAMSYFGEGVATVIETGSTVASCVLCVHVSRYAACGDPVAAGLSDRFEIVAHHEGGRGCLHFTSA
jgi:hypothetical protein